MGSRREELLDAAISVLGQSGIRGLTHRAVDAAASRPAGSASNHFRTRDALLDAVVERFAARERANWENLATRMYPVSPEELARALAVFAQEATGPHRTLTLARYAILVEAGNNPTIRHRLAEGGSRVNAWLANWMRLIGSRDTDHDVHVIANYVTGLILHQLAIPDPAFEPTDKITAVLESLVGPPDPPARDPAHPNGGARARSNAS